MLEKFYSDRKYNSKNNAYTRWNHIKKNVRSGEYSCCEEWRNFSSFNDWYWENSGAFKRFMHVSDNLYSPRTCTMEDGRQPNKKKGGNKSDTVIVLSPFGVSLTVTNRLSFCKNHELNYLGFSNMINKKTKSYKGWRLNWFRQ